jgi:hypothetical protein
MQLFITMCERGLVAEGATCLALISTCAKARQWQLSEEILLCTTSNTVALELFRKVGLPDSSRMLEADRELLVRLQNWRHSREAEGAAERTPPQDIASVPDAAAQSTSNTAAPIGSHSPSSTSIPAGTFHH